MQPLRCCDTLHPGYNNEPSCLRCLCWNTSKPTWNSHRASQSPSDVEPRGPLCRTETSELVLLFERSWIEVNRTETFPLTLLCWPETTCGSCGIVSSIFSGFSPTPVPPAVPAHLRCSLAHHSGFYGQVHACRIQWPTGEQADPWFLLSLVCLLSRVKFFVSCVFLVKHIHYLLKMSGVIII